MREIKFVNVTVLLFLLATLSASSAAEAPAPRTLKELDRQGQRIESHGHGSFGGNGRGDCKGEGRQLSRKNSAFP